MNSNIINMGDYRMDDDDRRLQALLAHPPLADDGFSARIVARLERRARVRRYILPTAFLAGVLVAAKPALQLLSRVTAEFQAIADGMLAASNSLAHLPAALLLVALLAGLAALRWLEE